MTSETQRTSDSGLDQSSGGRLLVSAAVDAYRLNAFRITGLPIDVPARELNIHVEKLRLLERLGSATLSPGGPLPLKPPPDAEVVRDAMQRLRNPVQRLVEEIFWFWPSTEAREENIAALKALETARLQVAVDTWRALERTGKDSIVASHNLAVLFHFLAVEADRAVSPDRVEDRDVKPPQDSYWRASLTRWNRALEQQAFWDFLASRMRQLDDPRLGSETLPRLRDCLPFTLASTGAQLAIFAIERNDLAATHRLVELLRSCGFDASILDAALVSAAEPFRARLKALGDDLGAKLESSPELAATSGERFLDQAAPILAGLDLLLPRSHPALIASHDEIAMHAMRSAITAGNSAEHWALPLGILGKAHGLARSDSAQSRITGNLRIATENEAWRVRGKPFADFVSSVVNSESSPSSKFAELKGNGASKFATLQEQNPGDSQVVVNAANMLAVALRGVSVALHNESERYREALEALELAIRVCRDAALLDQFRGDMPVLQQHAQHEATTSGLKQVRRAPSLSTFNGIGTQLMGNSDHRDGTYMATLYFTVFWIPILPLARYRVANLGGNTYRFLGRGPLRRIERFHQIVLAIAVVWLVLTTSGSDSKPSPARPADNFAGTRTQQLMSEAAAPAPAPPVAEPAIARQNAAISSLERNIEVEKQELATLESELGQMKAQLDEYQAVIDSDAATAKLLESEAASGISIDRSDYDVAVNRHNATVELHNALLLRFREKYKTYKNLLADANRKVATYNSLVRAR